MPYPLAPPPPPCARPPWACPFNRYTVVCAAPRPCPCPYPLWQATVGLLHSRLEVVQAASSREIDTLKVRPFTLSYPLAVMTDALVQAEG